MMKNILSVMIAILMLALTAGSAIAEEKWEPCGYLKDPKSMSSDEAAIARALLESRLRSRDFRGCVVASHHENNGRTKHEHMSGKDFRGGDFRFADLTRAMLDNSTFEGACLAGAQITGASVGGTIFPASLLPILQRALNEKNFMIPWHPECDRFKPAAAPPPPAKGAGKGS